MPAMMRSRVRSTAPEIDCYFVSQLRDSPPPNLFAVRTNDANGGVEAVAVAKTTNNHSSENGVLLTNGQETQHSVEDGMSRHQPPRFLGASRLIENLRPVLKMMQIFGYFPLTIHYNRLPSMTNKVALSFLPVVFIVLNCGLFSFNVYVTHDIRTANNGSILAVECISSIITGLKPCHNFMNLLIFLFLRTRHLSILKQMNQIDLAFRNSFSKSPTVKWHSITLFLLTIAVTATAFAVRLTQYIWGGEKPGKNYLSDLSLLFVCFLSTWQVLPLFYFEFLNRIVRYWYKTLNLELQSDRQLRSRSMREYYEHYVSLAQLLQKIGHFFNPFLFTSMCISVLVLCMTIYFVSEAPNIISFDPRVPHLYRILVYFLMVWSAMQIVVAILYVFAICVTGTITNEEARRIVTTVLRDVPGTAEDRHYAAWFVHMGQRQMGWGLSIWKAFPLERPLLFTLMSVMGTYAVVLLKLKQDNYNCSS